MHVNLFSIPVYKTVLSNHDAIREDFKGVLEDDSHFSKIPTWYSNVDTTFGNREADKLPWQKFIQSAVIGLNDYIEVFNLDLPKEYRVECWLNRYSPNQYQEIHNHAGESVISCAYMMRTPPDSGSFVFYKNQYDCFHQAGLPRLSSEPFKFNNRVTPPLEEGEIIYFPSNLEHYVSENRSNEIRATISANFIVTEKLFETNNG